MFRRLIGVVVATILLTFQLVVGSATAVELDEAIRTVPLNAQGDTVVLSLKQVKEGKTLFQYACLSMSCGRCYQDQPKRGTRTRSFGTGDTKPQ